MRTFLVSFAMLIISISLQAQQRAIDKVYFECNKSYLDSSSQKQLDKILKKLSEQRIIKVRVFGHTDSDGESRYNEKLSKERASIVSNYIISKGISSSIVKVDYYGESQPVVVVENSDIRKRENRRVMIIFEFVDLIIPKEFKVSSKVFKVNPDRDTVLKINSRGTKLHIPKNCFVDNRGIAVHDNVTLRYKEFTNSAEIVFSGIPMTYKQNDEVLCFNSSGMFEISGTVNNEPVQIGSNKSLKIDYALAKKNPEINFYKLDEELGEWKEVQHIKSNEEMKALEYRRLNVCRRVRYEFRGLFYEVDSTDEFEVGQTYRDIVGGLDIANFGMYNCDQLYRMKNRVHISGRFIDSDGKDIKDLYVFSVIDLRYNGAFSCSPESFYCDAIGQNVLVLFTKNKDFYILDKKDFDEMKISKSGEYVFKMKRMNEKIKGSKDLALYLGIKV